MGYIRRNTNSFQNAGSVDHARRISKSEVVVAWLNWLLTGTGKSTQKERDMICFGLANFLQSIDAGLAESKSFKLAIWKLIEPFPVESSL